MLPLYDFTIIFKRSSDYLKCLVATHTIAVLVLLHTSLPAMIDLPLIILLAISLYKGQNTPIPQRQFTQLTYQRHTWLIHTRTGIAHPLKKVHITLDGGFFLVLRLETETQNMRLILFKDQLSETQLRSLSVASKIT